MRATESPVYGNGVVCENADAVSGRSIRVAKLGGNGARVVDNSVACGLRVSTVVTLQNNSWPASTSFLEQVTGRASQHWQTSGVLRMNERAASAEVQEERSVEGLQTVDVEELPVLSTKGVVSLQIPGMVQGIVQANGFVLSGSAS